MNLPEVFQESDTPAPPPPPLSESVKKGSRKKSRKRKKHKHRRRSKRDSSECDPGIRNQQYFQCFVNIVTPWKKHHYNQLTNSWFTITIYTHSTHFRSGRLVGEGGRGRERRGHQAAQTGQEEALAIQETEEEQQQQRGKGRRGLRRAAGGGQGQVGARGGGAGIRLRSGKANNVWSGLVGFETGSNEELQPTTFRICHRALKLQ